MTSLRYLNLVRIPQEGGPLQRTGVDSMDGVVWHEWCKQCTLMYSTLLGLASVDHMYKA